MIGIETRATDGLPFNPQPPPRETVRGQCIEYAASRHNGPFPQPPPRETVRGQCIEYAADGRHDGPFPQPLPVRRVEGSAANPPLVGTTAPSPKPRPRETGSGQCSESAARRLARDYSRHCVCGRSRLPSHGKGDSVVRARRRNSGYFVGLDGTKGGPM